MLTPRRTVDRVTLLTVGLLVLVTVAAWIEVIRQAGSMGPADTGAMDMPGMTMPFKVRDERLLAGKAPGDLVTARLMVGPDEAWLAALDKTGSAPLEDAASFPAASFATPVKAGDTPPDATLTDQSGAPLTLANWRDAAVVVTFIYLRCPLPQFCPLMDRRFAEVQRLVQDDAALRGRVRLLSVSFDPRNDTPEAMTGHAAKLGADPAGAQAGDVGVQPGGRLVAGEVDAVAVGPQPQRPGQVVVAVDHGSPGQQCPDPLVGGRAPIGAHARHATRTRKTAPGCARRPRRPAPSPLARHNFAKTVASTGS